MTRTAIAEPIPVGTTFRIPDTADELLELTRDQDAKPLRVRLLGKPQRWLGTRAHIAEEPIGIYRMPRRIGERVWSEWPAVFTNLTDTPRRFVLIDHNGNELTDAGEAAAFSSVIKGDTLELSVNILGTA